MNYEEMLSQAYEKVDRTESVERFEIKKVEGHHEGTKTIVTNFQAVSSCLRRDPQHLAKFLSKELAAPTEIDGERLILARKVTSKDINQKILKYVQKYVTCSGCQKPDTELVEEDNKIILRCLACGNKKEVHNI